MKQGPSASEELENRQTAVRISLGPLREFSHAVKTVLQLQETSFALCFVSDAEMARLNKTYRKIAGPTDVLSFPSIARRGPLRFRRRKMLLRGGSFLGDIAISPATARRYAMKHGRSLDHELRILILHGVLHLLGYDHETDAGEMNRTEARLRRRLGIA